MRIVLNRFLEKGLLLFLLHFFVQVQFSTFAAEVRISRFAISPEGFFTVQFQGGTNEYYILRRGNTAVEIGAPAALAAGQDGTNTLADSQPSRPSASGYYMVESVPISAPTDVDADGIDDLYELRRRGSLDPLDGSDALRDANGDGRSNLEEYLLANSNGTATFETIADLVGRGVPGGSRYYLVSGYHTAGDGGGGLFVATNSVVSTNLGMRIFSGKAGWSYDRLYEGPVNVRWFGVKGDGITDNNDVFDNLVGWIGSKGGNVLIHGNPGDNYFIKTNKTVTNSFVTFDWRGARLSGHHRFIFNGDNGTNGSYASALTNVFFRNAVLGGAMSQDEPYRTRGPSFNWCVDSGAENIVKTGLSGTAFNVNFSKRVYLRNIWNHGGKLIEGGSIGFLIYHSSDTLLDNCHVTDGAFIYGFQIKGGQNNTVINSTCRDLVSDPGMPEKICFRDRGDAPWGPSASSGTYPFTTGSWDAADERRASVNTRWINCSALDSPEYSAFVVQEAIGSVFTDCSYENVGVGFLLWRLSGGKEGGFTITNPAGRNAFLGDGIRLEAVDPETPLEGVRITGGSIERSGRSGLFVRGSKDLQVTGLSVKNNGVSGDPSGLNKSGIAVSYSERPSILDCKALDDQEAPTQAYGILVSEMTVTNPAIQNCTFAGNKTAQIQSWAVGRYLNNFPGDGVATTIGGTNNDTIWRCYIPQGSTVWLETLVIGKEMGGTNQAVYRKGVLVSNPSGTATIQGGIVDLSPDNESDPAWNHTLYTSGGYVRMRVTGAAGQTVFWTLNANGKSL